MPRLIAIASALALAGTVFAWSLGWFASGQRLPGRLVTYKSVHDGLWELVCDTATDGSDAGCYVQYVDVYRPRPDFAAAMVELVYHPGNGEPDPHLRFDIEPGLSFERVTATIVTAEGTQSLDLTHCAGNSCTLTGEASRAVLSAWRAATALELTIDENRAEPARLAWPLTSMPAILDDLAAQRAARALP